MPDENEYELAPQEPEPQSKDPRAPGFVPPKPIVEKAEAEEDPAEAAERADAEANRASAMIAYLPGLFVAPLIFAHKSRFARYHANQGLLVLLYFLFMLVVFALATVPGIAQDHLPESAAWAATPLELLYVLGCFADTLAVVALFGLVVVGMINASNGEMKPLPVIGSMTLIHAEMPASDSDPEKPAEGDAGSEKTDGGGDRPAG